MLVLVGKTASGKDTIKKELLKSGMKDIVTCTTRPMRQGEIQGVNYHFHSMEEFLSKAKKGYFAEYTSYNVATGETWYYGTPKEAISDEKVIIMNPDGLKSLLRQEDLHIVSFYICAPEEVLLSRLEARGDKKEEYLRRLEADRKDFAGLEEIVSHVIVNDGTKFPEELASVIKSFYEKERTSLMYTKNQRKFCAKATLTDGNNEWDVTIFSLYKSIEEAMKGIEEFKQHGYNIVNTRIEDKTTGEIVYLEREMSLDKRISEIRNVQAKDKQNGRITDKEPVR